VYAIQSLLIEKGLVTADEMRRAVEVDSAHASSGAPRWWCGPG